MTNKLTKAQEKRLGEILDELGRQALGNYNGFEPSEGWMTPTRANYEITKLIAKELARQKKDRKEEISKAYDKGYRKGWANRQKTL